MRLLAAAFVFFTITAAAQAAEPVVAVSPEAQKAMLASKDPQLAANKKLVWDMWRTFLQGGDIDAADKYLAPEYHQHNPAIPNGTAGLAELFAGLFRQFPNLTVERKRVIAEGDLVAIHSHYRTGPEDRGQSVVDIFRVRADGKIVEHWDVVQDVPATSANDNTMF